MSNHVWLRPGFTSCDVAREVAAAVIEEGTMSSFLACKYYAQGYCQFGTHCHYAHDDWTAEKRVATSHSASAACMTALRTKSRLPVCKYFAQGYCHFGAQCRFAHDPTVAQDSDALKQAEPAKKKSRTLLFSGAEPPAAAAVTKAASSISVASSTVPTPRQGAASSISVASSTVPNPRHGAASSISVASSTVPTPRHGAASSISVASSTVPTPRQVHRCCGSQCPNDAGTRCSHHRCGKCCSDLSLRLGMGCAEHRQRRLIDFGREEIIDELGLAHGHFDEEYDFMYEGDVSSGSRKRMRGGEEFIWPAGWRKLALCVTKRYHSNDRDGNPWLDRDQGWPVAFHGTSGSHVRGIRDIVCNGFLPRGGESTPRNGEIFGVGIYCTPDPKFAAKYASDEPLVTSSGLKLEIVFQVRVRPGGYEEHAHKHGRCWVIKRKEDIRPCGILLREVTEVRGAR
jgi:hypothetical protein